MLQELALRERGCSINKGEKQSLCGLLCWNRISGSQAHSLHNLTEALPGMLSSVKADGPRLKVRGGKDLGEPTVQGYYWEQE